MLLFVSERCQFIAIFLRVPLERRPRYPSGRWPCSDLTRQNALVLFCSFV
jgi:hypothetical protein